MSRIKNFSANHEASPEGSVYYWEHTEENLTVEVRDTGIKYVAYICTETDERQLLPLKDDPNEARKVAVTWMRQNPEP